MLNANSLPVALTSLILVIAFMRYSFYDSRDPYKCNAAIVSGQWLDLPGNPSTTELQKWQPDGCMLRNYNSKSVTKCLSSGLSKDAIFIGDSTVREVFWATVRKVNATAAAIESARAEKHSDIVIQHGSTILRFVWDPFLNSSLLPQHLAAAQAREDDVERTELSMGKALVVVGGGLWFAKDKKDALEDFRNAMDKLAIPAKSHYTTYDYPGANHIFFLPVLPPRYESLDASHKAALKPSEIEPMNRFMLDLPETYGVDVLESYLLMLNATPKVYQDNGLHVQTKVADRQAEILLNVKCNNEIREYPYDGTCCFDYPVTWSQIGTLLVGAAIVVATGRVFIQEWAMSNPENLIEVVQKRAPLLWGLFVMWAGLAYCYLADRTQLFEKVTKQYSDQDFFIFCAAILIVGLATIKQSKPQSRPNQEKSAPQDQPFLSRDQTDEWKGWMQLMILAYHYTGASKVLWIYKLIRLMVASYLFMSGYGHAAYFYQKSDFSLKRVVAVNFRLNLLSALLPWMMDTDYLFYYFAPLVTYWYFVIYFTMRIKSSWNQDLKLFLAKIATAAVSTALLHTQPIVLSPIFELVNFVFGSRWDAKEWMFRCALDQYIVYVGMIVAVLYIRSTKPPAPPPPPQDPIATTAHKKPGSSPQLRQASYFVASAVAILVYTYGSSTQTTKSSSNALHTYISPLAILAFIHLRNSTRLLRNYYSAAYAWVGRISLETFILQYHLWLAADTKGLLSLGVFGNSGVGAAGGILGGGMGFARWVDCITLGIAFVWASSKVAAATGTISGAAMKIMF